MNKTIKSLALLLSLGVIASCGPNNNPTIGDSSNEITSNPGDSTEISTPDPIEETYKVILPKNSAYTVTSDKERAKKNEKVTITVEMASDVYTLTSIKLNNTKDLTLVEGTTNQYSFIMPNRDANITITVSVKGDMTLQGDVAAVLEKEGDIYVARDIIVNKTSYVKYVIGSKELDYQDIDYQKSFANISFNSEKSGFVIGGNAKYDFFYNPNASKPCYIVRTEVLNVPTSEGDLYSLFEGEVTSESSINPQNITKVTYEHSVDDVKYEWNLYNDNTSIAKAKKLSDGSDLGVVYKKIDGNNYTIVDSYLQRKELENNYFIGDDVRFSARKDIVETVNPLKQQITMDDARYALITPDHTNISMEYSMYLAYRGDFDTTWNEYLKDYDIDISSTKNDDGSFKTIIDSYKTFDYTSQQGGPTIKNQHVTYDVTLDFNKDGSIKSYDYKEQLFTNDAYDFTNNTFLPGGENLGKTLKTIKAEIEYGTPKEAAPAFDLSPYFITKFNNIHITHNNGDVKNSINQGDYLNDYLIKEEFEPSTALDSNQYRIRQVLSGDAVIQENNSLFFKAKNVGTSKILINNGTEATGLSVEIDVNVINDVVIKYYYLTDGQYAPESAPIETTNKATINGGHITRLGIATDPDKGDYTQLTFKIMAFNNGPEDTSVIQSVTHVNVGNYNYIDLDARNSTNKEPVTVLVLPMNPNHLEGSGRLQEPFEITVTPSKNVSDIYGKYETGEEGYEEASVTLLNEDAGDGYKNGTIVARDFGSIAHYTFKYKIEENGSITISSTSITSDNEDPMYLYDYNLIIKFNKDGNLEVYLGYTYYESYEDEQGADVIGNDIVGDYTYIEFIKVS